MDDLGQVDQACRHCAARLAEWARREIPRDVDGHVAEIISFGNDCIAGTRSRFLWEDTEEPWLFLSEIAEDGSLRTSQEIYSIFTPIVDPSFPPVPLRTRPGHSIVVHGEPSPRNVAPGEVINEAALGDLDPDSVVVLPIESSPLSGQLIVEVPRDQVVLLPLIALAGELAGARLDQMESTDAIAFDTVEQRVSEIARDLHDGVLQSFTGVVLQLETVHQLIEEDLPRARELVTELQSVLMSEQRDLRSYLERIRPKPKAAESEFDLRERLKELTRRYQSEWEIELSFDDSGVDPQILSAIGWETYRILTEAINNAARHGGARHIHATMISDGDLLSISVADDGDGFDFRGKLGLAELIESGRGPRSLIERVSGLNGTVEVESTDTGSTVTARVPVGWGG